MTNYSQKYGQHEYYQNHPILDEALVDFLIEKHIKMIGMDFHSPDVYPFKIHKKLLTNGILIIENMTNLEALLPVRQFEIIALPLKIRAEAAMARVIAKFQIN